MWDLGSGMEPPEEVENFPTFGSILSSCATKLTNWCLILLREFHRVMKGILTTSPDFSLQKEMDDEKLCPIKSCIRNRSIWGKIWDLLMICKGGGGGGAKAIFLWLSVVLEFLGYISVFMHVNQWLFIGCHRKSFYMPTTHCNRFHIPKIGCVAHLKRGKKTDCLTSTFILFMHVILSPIGKFSAIRGGVVSGMHNESIHGSAAQGIQVYHPSGSVNYYQGCLRRVAHWLFYQLTAASLTSKTFGM